MSIQLIHGDCLEKLKDLPAKSVDLVICDLPYGCLSSNPNASRKRFINGKDTGTILKGETIGACTWDIKIDLDKFWKEIERVLKDDHSPVLHFCSTKFGFDLIQSKPNWFRYDIVWEKTNAVGFLSANRMPLRAHEMIYVFSKAGAYYKRIDIKGDFPGGGGGRSKSKVYTAANDMDNIQSTKEGQRCVGSIVCCANKKQKGGHPTQKPEELYRWLIERYCPEGGTVLDPTAGSFTSCLAAAALGRKAIGIEKDEEFYKKALDKIPASLFTHVE